MYKRRVEELALDGVDWLMCLQRFVSILVGRSEWKTGRSSIPPILS